VSERRLGSFLAGRPRDEFSVCTKVGRRFMPAAGDVQGDEGFHDIPPLTRVRDYSRDGVRRSLEESLERLGLDRVDIVLIHDPDDYMEQAAGEAYPALAELRAQGTVRAAGAGMNSPAPLAWLVERCDLDCVLVAGRYTLLDDSAAASLFRCASGAGSRCWRAACSTAASWPTPATTRPTTTSRPRPACWPGRAGCATPAPATASRFPRRRSSSPCAIPP
jgi:D-threo-aldose 1-dehydrogenase